MSVKSVDTSLVIMNEILNKIIKIKHEFYLTNGELYIIEIKIAH